MAECSIKNLQLLWKLLVLHNKPMNLKVLLNYLEQFMSINESYRTIEKSLTLAFIDKTKNNQYSLSQNYWLKGIEYTISINPSLNEINYLKENTKIDFRDVFNGVVIFKSDSNLLGVEKNKIIPFNFKNICSSVGAIENVLSNLISIGENNEVIGYPFSSFSNSFSETQTKITNKFALYKQKINTHYSQYYLLKEQIIYAIPENNKDLLDTIKLLCQIDSPNKFIYDKKKSILTCKYCTIPYFIERILVIAHIMNTGLIPLNRNYFITSVELNYFNKTIFKNKFNLKYE